MNEQIIIQSLPVVGVVAFAFSFHAKTRKNILLFQMISLGLLIIHYAFLSATTGLVLSSINVILTTVFIIRDRYSILKSKLTLILSIIILVIATIFTWEGFYSIFALLGITWIFISKWQEDLRKIRMIAILASISWIAYDIFVNSQGGIIFESIIIVSILISLARNKNDK